MPKSYCSVVVRSDEFVPLATFLHPIEPSVPSTPNRTTERVDAGLARPQCVQASEELAETLSAVRCFRAALADALDVAVQSLLPAIARDVLGRELHVEPADLAVVVAEAVERFGREQVLVIRARSDEIGAMESLGVELAADDRFARGDAEIELRSGTIDMRLHARLEALLTNAGP
jgi:flagellar biosynthesis/type III secretory pathway protein FliH